MNDMLVAYYGKAMLNQVDRIPGEVLWDFLGRDVPLGPWNS